MPAHLYGQPRNILRPFHALRLTALVIFVGFTAGCAETVGQNGSGLGFSSHADVPQEKQASFARGNILLVPPKGFCIDSGGIRRARDSGFAMMARCDALGIQGFFGNRSPSVITATIGPRPDGAPVPGTSDLARLSTNADVLAVRDDLMLPLVQISGGKGLLPGAAKVHWRGALVLNDHLLSVALYAPEGSAGTSDQGAMLLNDLARRTLEASAAAPLAPPATTAPAPAAKPAASDAPLRPRLRPDPAPAPQVPQPAGFMERFKTLFS